MYLRFKNPFFYGKLGWFISQAYFHIAWAIIQNTVFIFTDKIHWCSCNYCDLYFPQAALGIMQMVEDTLIEHAHTKPLLPSQLVRYREVQLPDSKLKCYSFGNGQL